VLFPDRPRILGFKLEAPTLGHFFLLWRCGRMPIRAEIGTLVTALYILSRPWSKARRGINSGWIKFRFKLWGLQLRLLTGIEGREIIAASIQDWLDHAWDGPEVWEAPVEEEQKLSSSFLHVMKVRLMHLFHLTPERALDYSLREAIFDSTCWAEDHGRLEVVSSEFDGILDRAEKVADEIRAAAEKAKGGQSQWVNSFSILKRPAPRNSRRRQRTPRKRSTGRRRMRGR
jgi:hypothetical protein